MDFHRHRGIYVMNVRDAGIVRTALDGELREIPLAHYCQIATQSPEYR